MLAVGDQRVGIFAKENIKTGEEINEFAYSFISNWMK